MYFAFLCQCVRDLKKVRRRRKGARAGDKVRQTHTSRTVSYGHLGAQKRPNKNGWRTIWKGERKLILCLCVCDSERHFCFGMLWLWIEAFIEFSLLTFLVLNHWIEQLKYSQIDFDFNCILIQKYALVNLFKNYSISWNTLNILHKTAHSCEQPFKL